eukprot:COSAG01_NODE_3516_length_5981_cov_5.929446_2_plen_99_part_00
MAWYAGLLALFGAAVGMTVAFRESLGSGPPRMRDDPRCPQSTNAHEAGDGSEIVNLEPAVGVHGGWGRSPAVSCFCACIGSPCLRHCTHGASTGRATC